MKPSRIATTFATGLDRKFPHHTVAATAGRPYDRIELRPLGGAHSVPHAFVVRATGDLVAADTWNTPQKTAEGLCVRYRLRHRTDLARALTDADPDGAYLVQPAPT